jgi:MFS family permease
MKEERPQNEEHPAALPLPRDGQREEARGKGEKASPSPRLPHGQSEGGWGKEETSPSPRPPSGRGEGAGGRGEGPVPRLNLAPKLKRPLQPWNPLDYLRLLYWVFFFPQALRWYVETFADPLLKEAKDRAIVRLLQKDRAGRNLVYMGIFFVLLVSLLMGIGLQQVATLGWDSIAFAVVSGLMVSCSIGIMFSLVLGRIFDAAVGLASGIALGIATGEVTVVTVLSTFLTTPAAVLALIFGFGLGLIISIAMTLVVSAALPEEASSVLRGVKIFTVIFSIGLGIVVNYALGWIAGLISIAACIFGAFRLPEAILTAIPMAIVGPKIGVHHLTAIPLPGIQERLEDWLKQDWDTGIFNADQILAYTLQYTSIAKAITVWLEEIPDDKLLQSVNRLVDNAFGSHLFNILVPELKGIEPEDVVSSKISSPRAVCWGFWCISNKELEKAAQAFSRVRHIPYGDEMYGISRSLHEAFKAASPREFIDWIQIAKDHLSLPGPYLHPETMNALQKLLEVAGEVHTALHAVSPALRSSAVGRAVSILTSLSSTAENCEPPEAPIIGAIATRWREVLARWGGEIGEEVLLRPVENPFLEGASGRPVRKTFVGRSGVLERLERWWAGPPDTPLPVLILYGHRRMGKSSVLLQLQEKRPPNILVAPTDMQDLIAADHTGQLLQKFAGAIHAAARAAGLAPGPPPDRAEYASFGQATGALNRLLEHLDPQMAGRRLVLTVDEYELAEEKIEAGKFDPDFLRYLRAALGRHLWLNLILAGRQRLEEELRHYHAVFYGSAEPVKVTFLSRDEAVWLIRRPTDDFALDMEEPLAEEIYRLTGGQPYLIQRLCYELVERWNERFRREGRNTPRRVTVEDLRAMLTPEFFREFFLAAEYYFSGVWEEAGPDGQCILQAFAGAEQVVCPRQDLIRATGLDPEAGEKAFQTLIHHDLVKETAEGIRLSVPLMAWWLRLAPYR